MLCKRMPDMEMSSTGECLHGLQLRCIAGAPQGKLVVMPIEYPKVCHTFETPATMGQVVVSFQTAC